MPWEYAPTPVSQMQIDKMSEEEHFDNKTRKQSSEDRNSSGLADRAARYREEIENIVRTVGEHPCVK
jgi:hypothetical protein